MSNPAASSILDVEEAGGAAARSLCVEKRGEKGERGGVNVNISICSGSVCVCLCVSVSCVWPVSLDRVIYCRL